MNASVLVVGARPVGLTMAAELARYGVSVRIVEKAAQRTDKSKAIVMWSRSLEMLDRIGCAAPFLSAGLKVSGANIAAGVKQIAPIEVDRVASRHPYALGTGATAGEIVHHPPGLTGKANGLPHSGIPTRLECGKARIGAKAIQARPLAGKPP